jgi:hypothetical protein
MGFDDWGKATLRMSSVISWTDLSFTPTQTSGTWQEQAPFIYTSNIAGLYGAYGASTNYIPAGKDGYLIARVGQQVLVGLDRDNTEFDYNSWDYYAYIWSTKEIYTGELGVNTPRLFTITDSLAYILLLRLGTSVYAYVRNQPTQVWVPVASYVASSLTNLYCKFRITQPYTAQVIDWGVRP